MRFLNAISVALAALLSACSPWQQGLRVEDVPHRQTWQEQAQTVSVTQFFDYRMKNQLRKAHVGNWMILHEDAQFVYFGYPRFAGLFDERRLVEVLYRVPLAEVQVAFPGWKTLDGIAVRQQLLLVFPGQGISEWQAVLKPDRITASGKRGEGLAFSLDLDRQTGKPLLNPTEPKP